ncbi:MAG: flagellar basal body P-ring formation chaperone FlgA [Rubricoccaceae bacterium]
MSRLATSRLATSRLALLALLLAAPHAAGQSSARATPEAVVAAAAQAALEVHFPEAAPRLGVRVERLSPALASAVAAGEALDVAWPGAGVPRGLTRVTARAAGAPAGWALLRVAHRDTVLVARRALARGTALAPEAFETAVMETTALRTPPADPAALAGPGAVLRRALRAGDVLRAADVALPPEVPVGAPVTVRYVRGGVALALAGHAREAGRTGDAIRVYSRATGATYRVRLTRPDEGEWLETLR